MKISRLELGLVVTIVIIVGAVVLLSIPTGTEIGGPEGWVSRTLHAAQFWRDRGGWESRTAAAGTTNALDLVPAATGTVAEVLGVPESRRGGGAGTGAATSRVYRSVAFVEDGVPVYPAGEAPSSHGHAARRTESPDPLDVLKAIIDTSEGRKRALQYVCESLDQESILDALAMVEAMEWGPEANALLQQLMVRWGELDPSGAIDYAGDLESRRARNGAIGNALTGWAQEDPQTAYEWFAENLAADPATLSMSVRELFGVMSEYDQDWALECVWQLPTKSLKQNALRSVVGTMDDEARQEMIQLYNTLPAGENKTLVAAAIVGSWSIYYPETAAAWVMTLSDPESRAAAMSRLVTSWGYDRPENAANWILGLPSSERAEQISKFVQTWAKQDPIEASAWLGQFSPSPELDPAIQSLVRVIMREDPAEAMYWAESLTVPKERNRLQTQVATQWVKTDPTAARYYIAHSNLPAKIKQRFLRW